MFTKRLPISALILTFSIAWPGPAPCPAAPPGEEPVHLPVVYDDWQTFTTGDGLPDDRVRAVHVAGDTVWVGTEGGLARFENGSWTSWTATDGLPAPAISAIDLDPRSRDIWLGTWGGGLARFTGGRFDRYGQLNSGLAGNLVFAVAVTGDRVWAATNGGLSSYDLISDTWDLHFERRADTAETAITGLCLQDDHLYAAAWCGGLWELQPGPKRWSVVVVDDTALGVAATQGYLWLATPDTVMRRDGDAQWDVWPAPGVAGARVGCVGTDGNGNVHLGTDQGLQILTDRLTASWITYRRHGTGPQGLVTLARNGRTLGTRVSASGLPDNRVRSVAFQDEVMWVATPGGLARSTHKGTWKDLPRAPAHAEAASIASEPIDTDVIRIGVLRPGERMIGVPGSPSGETPRLRWVDLMAVNLALEQANDRGGYRGKIPFALATGPQGWFTGWGWTTPEDNFPELANQREVAGIVAYLGSGSRLTTAAALRTEVPVVNFAPTAATTDETINPWIFRCHGNEPLAHRLLLDYVFDQLGCAKVAMLRDAGRPDPVQLDWWRSNAAAWGLPVVADLRCEPGPDGLANVLKELQESGADVVLTWSDAHRSAVILRAMRQAGMDQLFVGSDGIMSDEFVALTGPEPGAVIAACPRTGRAEPTASARFADDYMQRFRRPPTPGAFWVFAAVNHLVEAINIAGPDREAVRRALDAMGRDLDGERHCSGVGYGPDLVILGRLGAGGWNLHTISDLGLAAP
ncbi:MAG: ABC transporter substrate-binding protein [Planctomycetota bacterium]|jgi:ABC-type branched-subunit amino acid transport system substrate-binding protein